MSPRSESRGLKWDLVSVERGIQNMLWQVLTPLALTAISRAQKNDNKVHITNSF